MRDWLAGKIKETEGSRVECEKEVGPPLMKQHGRMDIIFKESRDLEMTPHRHRNPNSVGTLRRGGITTNQRPVARNKKSRKPETKQTWSSPAICHLRCGHVRKRRKEDDCPPCLKPEERGELRGSIQETDDGSAIDCASKHRKRGNGSEARTRYRAAGSINGSGQKWWTIVLLIIILAREVQTKKVGKIAGGIDDGDEAVRFPTTDGTASGFEVGPTKSEVTWN